MIIQMINVSDLQIKLKFSMKTVVEHHVVVTWSVKFTNGALLALRIVLQLNLVGLAKQRIAGIPGQDGFRVDEPSLPRLPPPLGRIVR